MRNHAELTNLDTRWHNCSAAEVAADCAGFRFMLTGTDGALPGRGGTDRLHLKVWAASGGVIYDNEPGAADDASAPYAIDSAIPSRMRVSAC